MSRLQAKPLCLPLTHWVPVGCSRRFVSVRARLHACPFAGNDELQRAFRQRATEEAEAALAERLASELAMEMADARTAAVAEQRAQLRRPESNEMAHEAATGSYGIMHDRNPAAPAADSPAAAAAAAVAAAQGGVRGRGRGRAQNVDRQQLSMLEQQARAATQEVLRQVQQRQTQQHPRAPKVQAQQKKTKKTRAPQSADDEVKHIRSLLAGGKHGVHICYLPANLLRK